MLCFNPEQRLTADECLTHPIFDKFRNETDEEYFEGNIQLEDLDFLEDLDKPINIYRLKGIINNEISSLMQKQIREPKSPKKDSIASSSNGTVTPLKDS